MVGHAQSGGNNIYFIFLVQHIVVIPRSGAGRAKEKRVAYGRVRYIMLL